MKILFFALWGVRGLPLAAHPPGGAVAKIHLEYVFWRILLLRIFKN